MNFGVFLFILNSDSPVEEKCSTGDRCPSCGQQVPANNMALHSLRCKPPPAAAATLSEGAKCAKKKKKKKPPPERKEPSGKQPENKEAEEDFDLLEEAARINAQCSLDRCKTSVKAIGSNCQFCKCRFCISHALPEAHGCGAAAKCLARSDALAAGQRASLRGSQSAPPRPVSATKKVQLQRKLHKQLDEMQQHRSVKTKK